MSLLQLTNFQFGFLHKSLKFRVYDLFDLTHRQFLTVRTCALIRLHGTKNHSIKILYLTSLFSRSNSFSVPICIYRISNHSITSNSPIIQNQTVELNLRTNWQQVKAEPIIMHQIVEASCFGFFKVNFLKQKFKKIK